MKRILLLVILLSSFCFHRSYSQAPGWLWAHALGATDEEIGQSVAVDAAGNVYSTGYFEGTVDFDPGIGTTNFTATGSKDVFILKSDSSGNLVWAKRIGGNALTESYAIALDDSGNVYLTGRFSGTVDFDPGTATAAITFSGGSYDLFISRLSSAGDFVWAKAMPGAATLAYSIDVDAAGNVYTAGVFAGTTDFDPDTGIANLSAISWDMFISKLDPSGSFLWARRTGGNNYDYAYSIAIDDAAGGAVYATGGFQGLVDFDPGVDTANLSGSSGSSSAFVSKLDSAGNFAWAKEITGIGGHSGSSVAIASFGKRGVYVTGTFEGTTDFDPGPAVSNLTSAGVNDAFISRLDSSGNFVWAKAMGGMSFDFGQSAALAPDGSGSVFTAGVFNDSADFDTGAGTFNLVSNGSSDIFITRLDSMGNLLWAKAAGGTGTEHCKSIALNASADVFVIGEFDSPSIAFGFNNTVNANASGGETDVYLARLDHLVTGMEDVFSVLDISVYPNPFTQEIVFHIQKQFAGKEPGTLTLFELTGKEIQSQSISQDITIIQTKALEPGLYLLRARIGNATATLKMVKY